MHQVFEGNVTALISNLVKELEIANAKNSALEEQTGACLISLSSGAKPQCGQLTKDQCNKVGGVFLGGDCP